MIQAILSNLQGILVFIGVLSVLIVVHEWGHFITAKRLGVQVDEFAIGFGPTLISKLYHGTKYMIKLYPLGGYVKMAGDERDKCKGTPQEFCSKPVGHRALIVLNGPAVNFVLAYICFVFVFMLGYPDLSTKVGELIDGYPAQQAGLQIGDQIIRINGKDIDSWTRLQENIAESRGKEIKVDVLREERQMAMVIVPKVENNKNIFGQEKEVRIIGIRPQQEIIALKYGFGTSLVKAYQKLAEITTMTYKSIYYMITGSMSAKESVTGPIGIFYIVKSAAEMGVTHLLFILGVISASLAIFNLFPVIPLDGGHLFLLGIEKLRGRALPSHINESIAKVGFSMIILLALFVFYSDFARFGWFDKVRQIFP